MSTGSTQLSTFGRGWRWLNRFGLLVPLIIGAVLAVLVAITLISPRYHSPSEVNAGSPDDYAVGEPAAFKEQSFWLVRLPAGQTTLPGEDFVALYDRDPVTGCALSWGKTHEFMGLTGWFRDACSGSTYDLTGACFDGPCGIGLNRLNVELVDGELIIDPNDGPRGALKTENGDPVNPPQ
jgi:hypothetical protein